MSTWPFLPKGRRLDTGKDTQFSDAWIVLGLLLTLLGLALDHTFLTMAAVFLFVVVGSSWLWAAASLNGLHYRRRFSEERAFQGETVTLTLELHNRHWLPLPWIAVRDRFPPELPVAQVELDYNPTTHQADFNTFWSLGPYRQAVRQFTVQCSRRGFHRYGPAVATTGDGFGFFNRRGLVAGEQRLIVYPRLYPAQALRLPTKNPFGAVRTANPLFEDPLRTAGTREWQSGDSLRRVHWKATARLQQMQSRVYEPAEEPLVIFFLNVTTLPRHWHGYIPELQERTISVAASLAALADQERLATGLVANGALPGSDQPIRVPASRNPNRLTLLLEMLAAVTPFATQPIEQLLMEQARQLPWGAILAVVTAVIHDELLITLQELATAGRRLVLFTLAAEPPRTLLPGVDIYHLPHLVEDWVAPVRVDLATESRP